MKENKMEQDQDKAKLFCWYLRDNLIELGVLTGDMIKHWRTKKINDFEKMKEMTRATFDLKGLNEILIEQGIIPDPNAESKMAYKENFKLKTTNYTSLWFNILKIWIKNQFYSTGEVVLNEQKYQNKLYKAVKAHSTSKTTNKQDWELIKADSNINKIMLHICKGLQVIYTGNGGLEFNTTEIENILIDYKKDPEFLLNMIRPFVEEYLETH